MVFKQVLRRDWNMGPKLFQGYSKGNALTGLILPCYKASSLHG